MYRIKRKHHTDYVWIGEIRDEYKKNGSGRIFLFIFFNFVNYERAVIFLFLFLISEFLVREIRRPTNQIGMA